MTRTRSTTLAAMLAATALTLGAAAVSAADGGRKLATDLSGAEEVPGPGDPDGEGSFTARVNLGQGQVCYTLTVSGIAPATGAHIHEAFAGSAGPVVVALTPPTAGSSSGCATISKELAKDLIQQPEEYYVNVHNAAFPGGAVRGQLGG